MRLRILQSIGQLAPGRPSAMAKASSLPVVRAAGSQRWRHLSLFEYDILEIEADVDVVWMPGSSKVKMGARDTQFRQLKIEASGRSLRIHAACEFEGERPSIMLWGSQLAEIRTAASCSVHLLDVKTGMLLLSASDASSLRVQGHVKEVHVEAQNSACVDCASLICEIAAADLAGDSVALLRAESALQAETRNASHLLTIGSPRILDVKRHDPSFSMPKFSSKE